jgi:hypothetical protein
MAAASMIIGFIVVKYSFSGLDVLPPGAIQDLPSTASAADAAGGSTAEAGAATTLDRTLPTNGSK